jgi:hypothetical protein
MCLKEIYVKAGYRVVYATTLVLSLWSGVAYATHENDHRFTVFGYVRDQQGNAVSGKTVGISHIGGEKKSTTTNVFGYYEVVLHLHNENKGDEIDVVTGDETKKITAEFDPNDLLTLRSAEVDFGAPGKSSGVNSLTWGGAIAGAAVISYFGYNYLRKKGRSKKTSKRSPKKRKK